ncbi:MAG: D-aminoacylase [Chitinophagaceae bacterium]|nr:D-aminoacylase [Chitinophagaceae bacterium]
MRIITVLIFLAVAFSSKAQTIYDIIIRNGKIIDGSGNNWYYSDVAIHPGFIDVHTHLEGDEDKDPEAKSFIYDGVTTCVTGNCGSSHVDIGKYLRWVDSLKTSINIATLVGHNDVREAAMGKANRDATPQEMEQMKLLVEKAMKDGAVGLSTGLIYTPGVYSKTPEITELAKVAAKFNGLYATHMRDEGDSIEGAVNEALTIGREAKIPVEISHYKISGQQNWGKSKITVPLIDAARKEGLEVTIDQYPYTASSTTIGQLIPDEILADGEDSVKARLKNLQTRKYVVKYMLERLKKRKLKHFAYVVVAYHSADTTYNGKSVEEINLMKGRKHKAKDEAETVIDIMVNGGASAVFHGMSEDDIKRIMKYPFNMFASDATIRVLGRGMPHPRGYGTNARILSKYVREEKVVTLEEAIRRMTSLPALKFQLKDRGLIKEGMTADIVVFDEAQVKDLSTFDKPHAYSTGFHYVIVNGVLTVDNEKHTGARAGKALYSKN